MQDPNKTNNQSGLLQANLTRVFNERDAQSRLQALADLHTTKQER